MMRMIGVAVLRVAGMLAAGLMAGPAGAQLAASGLRPGEVALHIVARGETTSSADRIVVPVTVTGHGATVPAARAAADVTASQVTAALVAAGIDRSAIVMQRPAGGPSGFDPAALAAAMTGGIGSHAASRSGTVTMKVTVADRAGLDRVTQVLATQEQAQAGAPVPSLRNEAPARRAAVAAALDRAQHDADDYAAPLGLRVARVAAVSNAAGLADGVAELTEAFSALRDGNKTPDTVVTHATAVVDYVLAPRS